MIKSQQQVVGQQAAVDDVLADYLQRVDKGETVDREVFVADHPEVADALPSYLAGADEVDRVVGSTSSSIKLALLGVIPLMLIGAVSWATVIYIRSADQTIKIEIDDPTAKVTIDGAEITITGIGDTITLKRGMHELIVQRGDTVVYTRNFEVVKGKNPVLRITLEQNAGIPAAKTTPSPTAVANRRAAEWVLSVGGYLYFSSEDTEGIFNKIEKVEDVPQGLFDITIVRLGGKQFDEADLKNLQGLPKLRELELTSTSMTGSGFAHLVNLPSLVAVNISRSAMTDEGMFHVAKLPKLSNLSANEIRFGDTGVEHLAGHPTLKTLALSGANITDGCVVHIKQIPKLDNLSFHNALITDAALVHLAEMTSLTRINLQNTKITDVGLMHLAKREGLTYLDVRSTKVTDTGLMHLKSLPKLTQLWVNGVSITDQGALDLNAAREAADLPEITVAR
jgi:hypothetical protein